MIKEKDFVLVGIQPWHIKIGSNFKNIAYELSKNNRVLYVNLPNNLKLFAKSLFSFPKKKEPLLIKPIQQINDNLFILTPSSVLASINWLRHGNVYHFLNKRNAKIYCRSIQKALNELRFKDSILINDSLMMMGVYLKEFIRPSFYLYYIRDNLVEQPYFSKHGACLEPETIRVTDAVAANSEFLAEYARKYNPKSYMVGQGCELNKFDELKNAILPNEFLVNLKRPVIGYVGNLTSSRLDIELLEVIARTKPNWSLVLVGPEDQSFRNSSLHQFSNVHFPGLKPLEELPGWIKGFDVCLNPQLVNSNTIGNYPRKIDEYLAMGKPVVATDTLAMQYFKKYVYLGRNNSDFIYLIEKALIDDHVKLQKMRKLFANEHSWSKNVENICRVIEMNVRH